MEQKDKKHVSAIHIPNPATSVGDRSKISVFFEKLQSVNTLYLLSSLLQVLMGASVVLLSVLELIQPRWLSTLLSMLGSITTMIGLFLFYNLISMGNDEDQLLRKAMRRIMNAHN